MTAPVSAHDPAPLQAAHGALLALCDTLERIADSLPRRINAGVLSAAAAALVPLVENVHGLEAQWFHARVEQETSTCFSALMMERLRAGHRHDRAAAQELALTLRAVLRGDCGLSRETIGYMLRGFFGTVRRHVASSQQMMSALHYGEPA